MLALRKVQFDCLGSSPKKTGLETIVRRSPSSEITTPSKKQSCLSSKVRNWFFHSTQSTPCELCCPIPFPQTTATYQQRVYSKLRIMKKTVKRRLTTANRTGSLSEDQCRIPSQLRQLRIPFSPARRERKQTLRVDDSCISSTKSRACIEALNNHAHINGIKKTT